MHSEKEGYWKGRVGITKCRVVVGFEVSLNRKPSSFDPILKHLLLLSKNNTLPQGHQPSLPQLCFYICLVYNCVMLPGQLSASIIESNKAIILYSNIFKTNFLFSPQLPRYIATIYDQFSYLIYPDITTRSYNKQSKYQLRRYVDLRKPLRSLLFTHIFSIFFECLAF